MKSRTASRGERRRGVETWRGYARRQPGWRCNSRRSQMLWRGRFAEQQRGQRRKQSLSERSSAEGNRKRPRPGGQRSGPRRPAEETAAGALSRAGVPLHRAVRAGIPKTDTAPLTPPPYDCPLPGVRPLLVTCPPANGSLSPAPGYYLQAGPPSLLKGAFLLGRLRPRLLARPGESPVCGAAF